MFYLVILGLAPQLECKLLGQGIKILIYQHIASAQNSA